MRNIFSCIDFAAMHQEHRGDAFFNLTENFLFKTVPLDLSWVNLTYDCTLAEWQNEFERIVEDKSPRQLAELSLEIGKGYQCFQNNTTDDYGNIFSYIIGDKDYNKERIIRVQDLLSEEELIANLVCSYFYHSATITKNASDCVERYALDNFNEEKFLGVEDRLDQQKDAYYKKNPLFMYSFMRLKEKPKNKKILFTIDNPYDTGIILSLLATLAKKSNPFVLSEKDEDDINLINMKNNYKYMPLMKEDEDNITFRLKEKVRGYYNHNYAYIYNQYILERLSAMNFFTKLISSDIPKDSPLYYAMKNFSNCPLIDFRLKLLDFNEKEIGKNYSIVYDIDWCKSMMRILQQLVKCTIPIYEVIFNYLMEMRYKKILGRSNNSKKKNLINDDMEKEFNNTLNKQMTGFYKRKSTSGEIYLGKSNEYKLKDGVSVPADLYKQYFRMVTQYEFDHIFSNRFYSSLQELNMNVLRESLIMKSSEMNGIITGKDISGLYPKRMR